MTRPATPGNKTKYTNDNLYKNSLHSHSKQGNKKTDSTSQLGKKPASTPQTELEPRVNNPIAEQKTIIGTIVDLKLAVQADKAPDNAAIDNNYTAATPTSPLENQAPSPESAPQNTAVDDSCPDLLPESSTHDAETNSSINPLEEDADFEMIGKEELNVDDFYMADF
ncbi:hypothetical protein [Paraburkholderia bonniea]|uniref:hypothetical protein n=1 Tax=Paraburkholderia bonniea TaxID=2152891 RepID=UPI0012923BC8|nr:hypothetical protein [Paraburkholderia bonniea]